MISYGDFSKMPFLVMKCNQELEPCLILLVVVVVVVVVGKLIYQSLGVALII